MVYLIEEYLIIKKGVSIITRTFEDKMMDIIHRCVSICADNVEGVPNVNKVFIMLWREKTVTSTMYDYEINGEFVRRHEPGANSASKVFATFDELQIEHELLKKLFDEDNREFPVAFKMIYSPQTNKFNMHLEYDLITERTGEDISVFYKEWATSKIGMETLDAK